MNQLTQKLQASGVQRQGEGPDQSGQQLENRFHRLQREAGFWTGCRDAVFFLFLCDPSLMRKWLTNMMLHPAPKKMKSD